MTNYGVEFWDRAYAEFSLYYLRTGRAMTVDDMLRKFKFKGTEINKSTMTRKRWEFRKLIPSRTILPRFKAIALEDTEVARMMLILYPYLASIRDTIKLKDIIGGNSS